MTYCITLLIPSTVNVFSNIVCEKNVWVGHIYTSVTTRENDDKWLSHWLGHVTGIYLKYQNPFTLKWAKLKYDITNQLVLTWDYPVDTGRKLNVHKTFRRRPGRLLNVLCTFNLRPVSTGYLESFEGPRMSRAWEIENWLITENNYYVKSDACAEPSKCDFVWKMFVR